MWLRFVLRGRRRVIMIGLRSGMDGQGGYMGQKGQQGLVTERRGSGGRTAGSGDSVTGIGWGEEEGRAE